MDELLRRLEELEIRYAFQQDELRQLDEVVLEQAARIEALATELRSLREQVDRDASPEPPPEEQVPPHY
jgi:uncharacterized coiled-coil protein SlyX